MILQVPDFDFNDKLEAYPTVHRPIRTARQNPGISAEQTIKLSNFGD